jgi:hypothetical protein
MPHRDHHRMLAVRNSIHGNRPNPMQRIEAANQRRNGQESQRK